MRVEEVENTIPVIIHYNYQIGFKYHEEYDSAITNESILISDFVNIPMKCFEDKYGIWNDKQCKRELMFEL